MSENDVSSSVSDSGAVGKPPGPCWQLFDKVCEPKAVKELYMFEVTAIPDNSSFSRSHLKTCSPGAYSSKKHFKTCLMGNASWDQ